MPKVLEILVILSAAAFMFAVGHYLLRAIPVGVVLAVVHGYLTVAGGIAVYLILKEAPWKKEAGPGEVKH